MTRAVHCKCATLMAGLLLAGNGFPAEAQITDPDGVYPMPSMSRPMMGEAVVDPVFGTTLRRISSASDSGGFATQVYSQLQAFSPDNRFVLLTGSMGYVVLRTADLTPVAGLNTAGWNVPKWHPAKPATIVHFDTNADDTVRLQYTEVDPVVETLTVYTFPAQYLRIYPNQSFDDLSLDGRWTAVLLARDDGQAVIVAFDLENTQLGAQLAIDDLYASDCDPDPEWGNVWPDWVGVSPLGRYLMVQWEQTGMALCRGLESYDLVTGEFVGRVHPQHPHGDLGTDGVNEYFMTIELAGPIPYNGNPALAYRMIPGEQTVSPPNYILVNLPWTENNHLSCRGPNGTGLISFGGWDDGVWRRFEEELVLVTLDGQVSRLAHHRSTECGYWTQPRASISRDGDYVIFASDWLYGSGSNSCDANGLPDGQPEAFVIELTRADVLMGDLNCDGTLDVGDIGPFIHAILGAQRYEATYPDCDRMLGDFNDDGRVDGFDISPFVKALVRS